MSPREYRTLDQVVEEHFRNHPEEIEGYLRTALEEYEKDGDETALRLALRQIVNAQGGAAALAGKTNLPRDDIEKALSPTGDRIPQELLQRILEALGCPLSREPIGSSRR